MSSRFITNSKLRPDVIYVKNGNETIIIITIDKNWVMCGTQLGRHYKVYPVIMRDEDCKDFLSGRVAPNRGKDMLDSLGLTEYDTMELLYRSRGIQRRDNIWLAWSDDDKAEDYHPNFNEKIAELRVKGHTSDD